MSVAIFTLYIRERGSVVITVVREITVSKVLHIRFGTGSTTY